MKWPCSHRVQPSRHKTPGHTENTSRDENKIIPQRFHKTPIIPTNTILDYLIGSVSRCFFLCTIYVLTLLLQCTYNACVFFSFTGLSNTPPPPPLPPFSSWGCKEAWVLQTVVESSPSLFFPPLPSILTPTCFAAEGGRGDAQMIHCAILKHIVHTAPNWEE